MWRHVSGGEGWRDAGDGAVGIDSAPEGAADGEARGPAHPDRDCAALVVDGDEERVGQHPADPERQLDRRRVRRGRCGSPAQQARRIQPAAPLDFFGRRKPQRGAQSVDPGGEPLYPPPLVLRPVEPLSEPATGGGDYPGCDPQRSGEGVVSGSHAPPLPFAI